MHNLWTRRKRKIVYYCFVIGSVWMIGIFGLSSFRLPQAQPPVTSFGKVVWQDSCCGSQTSIPQNGHNNSIIQPESIRQVVHEINSKQSISDFNETNELKCAPLYDKDHPAAVFVIQIHSRLENLRLLIDSLQRVHRIECSLIVFSSDVYSSEINDLVHSVRFARAILIYYPHSIQTFPNIFPGLNPTDCVNRTSEKTTNCITGKWKDRFKNYRTPRLTQVKHHWLWKANFVFNHLRAMSTYTGYVIFLEEDHFVVEDIIHVMHLLEQHWNPSEAKGVLAFGSYDKTTDYKVKEVSIEKWVSSRHNMGMGISRAMWNRIAGCLKVFCEYDDYNWDWSLQHTAMNCISNDIEVLYLRMGTRVYHLGECSGLHHHRADCSARQTALKLTQKLNGPDLPSMYPTRLEFKPTETKRRLKPRVNGGWADPRDQALCMSIGSSNWLPSLQTWAPELTSHSPVF